jgi:hypothetical protein
MARKGTFGGRICDFSGHFVAVETHADSELALGRSDRLYTHNQARTTPFGRGLTGDFFGHLEKDLEGITFVEQNIAGEKDAALRDIYRFAALFGNLRFQRPNAKSGLEVVTPGQAPVRKKTIPGVIHGTSLSARGRDLGRATKR